MKMENKHADRDGIERERERNAHSTVAIQSGNRNEQKKQPSSNVINGFPLLIFFSL